jgi:hypothetical protein
MRCAQCVFIVLLLKAGQSWLKLRNVVADAGLVFAWVRILRKHLILVYVWSDSSYSSYFIVLARTAADLQSEQSASVPGV